MAIVLSVDDLLEAAGKVLDRREYHRLSNAVIVAASKVAEELAAVEGVKLSSTTHEPGFGGLCATFRRGPEGQTSQTLGDLDPDGEW